MPPGSCLSIKEALWRTLKSEVYPSRRFAEFSRFSSRLAFPYVFLISSSASLFYPRYLRPFIQSQLLSILYPFPLPFPPLHSSSSSSIIIESDFLITLLLLLILAIQQLLNLNPKLNRSSCSTSYSSSWPGLKTGSRGEGRSSRAW